LFKFLLNFRDIAFTVFVNSPISWVSSWVFISICHFL